MSINIYKESEKFAKVLGQTIDIVAKDNRDLKDKILEVFYGAEYNFDGNSNIVFNAAMGEEKVEEDAYETKDIGELEEGHHTIELYAYDPDSPIGILFIEVENGIYKIIDAICEGF